MTIIKHEKSTQEHFVGKSLDYYFGGIHAQYIIGKVYRSKRKYFKNQVQILFCILATYDARNF